MRVDMPAPRFSLRSGPAAGPVAAMGAAVPGHPMFALCDGIGSSYSATRRVNPDIVACAPALPSRARRNRRAGGHGMSRPPRVNLHG
jgi:hypothetical protein